MKTVLWTIGIIFLLIVLSVVSFVINWTGKAADVVAHEIDPQVLQQKYEWFKDASSQLDSRLATLSTYKLKIARVEKLAATDRVSREQLMIWEQEQQGVKASYNDLAAEYNAQMAKWNWRFCNVGGSPQGATQILPRNYKPYIEE
jgi:hypothetical protein